MTKHNNPLLDSLFIRHREELVAFAEQKHNNKIAEDLVQDAFLLLMQHADLHSIDNHRAYLYKITANLSAGHFRKKSFINCSNEDEAEFKSITCHSPQPDKIAESQETYRHCMQALDSLPGLVRTVFLLHRVDGISQAEIGKTFNLPLRTVERYCAKALTHCSQILDHQD